MKLKQPVAICNLRRTPFAQIAKALGKYPAHHLGRMVAEDIIKQSGIKKDAIDGVIVGEGFPGAPNAARVIANLLELPNEIPAVTVNQNCVSALEAVADAARRINLGEGDVYLTIGEESQTSMPFVVAGARLNKKTGTVAKLNKLLPDDLPEGVELRDMLEDGLNDGETSYGMHITAELVAQNYEIPKKTLDKVAYESFKRALEATEAGKYAWQFIEVKDEKGNVMEGDEAVLLRKGLVENPGRMDKAMMLFDNPHMKWDQFKEKYGKDLEKTGEPTTSIFNACPRSDGAAGVIVTTPEKAKELGLDIQAIVTGYCMKGVHPNRMGIGQAEATLGLLEDMGTSMEELDNFELHEAFAATAVGAMEEIKKRTGYDWEKDFDSGKINPHGGSIAIGHPFGATGIRLIGNVIMDFKANPDCKKVATTACAHGGVAGALMLERPE